MNSIGYFEIHSGEPAREIEFYKSVFGWRFVREENHPLEYYRIETDTIYGGLLKRPEANSLLPIGMNAYVCSIQVESFDRCQDLILSHCGLIALAKFPVPGRCWQGYFLDTDKNTFGIFEADENAA